jgi:DMSO/TMAO reductase YedYZ molybdopterin-dependent catalytic subunit
MSEPPAPISTGYLESGLMRANSSMPPNSVAEYGYLTPQDKFGDVERGNPLPYTLPLAKRREVGLERDTWRLEVIADPDSSSRLGRPLTEDAGTALDFSSLMKLAERNSVRYLKAMTCNNLGEPLGVGLWEGVPLRLVIWMAQPRLNVRRVYYYGYDNDDPKQVFQSSLPLGRVLEDPPGELPVILAYKLNGEFLTGKRGGPVRMVVPEAYGFKSVKWLKRVVLTNDHRANDTYALGNNDIDSPMKTFARFVHVPERIKAGEPLRISGLAQVGVSGLAGVQYWLEPAPAGAEPPQDRRFHGRMYRHELRVEDGVMYVPENAGDWRDATILTPPARWGAMLPEGRLPETPLFFDPATGMPRQWPLRYTIAYWSAVAEGVSPGRYALRCRSIDNNGAAQPMPRPFAKSGRAEIQQVMLYVEP